MVDIRDKIEEDRGAIKKIQLLIPGYSGYRRGEDLRNADNILRNQIADMLRSGKSQLDEVRSSIVDHPDNDMLHSIGKLIFTIQDIEGKIRHMTLGYSGISWDIKVTPEIEERLYEYDYQLGTNVKSILDTIPTLKSINEKSKFISSVNDIMTKLSNVETIFSNRLNEVKNIKAY
ncbi:MAG: hypothetical protein ACP5RS_01155 [Thermoplasmata archaeon]